MSWHLSGSLSPRSKDTARTYAMKDQCYRTFELHTRLPRFEHGARPGEVMILIHSSEQFSLGFSTRPLSLQK